MVRIPFVLAAAACVFVSPAADGAAGASRSAIRISVTPRLQTLDTAVVARAGKPALSFGTARFTITVTNPTTATLSGVTVADPRSAACSRTIGTLTAHASVVYSCSSADVARGYTNVISVSAHPSNGVRGLAAAQATARASAASSVRVRAKVATAAGVPLFTG